MSHFTNPINENSVCKWYYLLNWFIINFFNLLPFKMCFLYPNWAQLILQCTRVSPKRFLHAPHVTTRNIRLGVCFFRVGMVPHLCSDSLWSKTPVILKKKDKLPTTWYKNGILQATIGRSSVDILADIDLSFRRPTNFMSVVIIRSALVADFFSRSSTCSWNVCRESLGQRLTIGKQFVIMSVVGRSIFRHSDFF